MKIRRITDFTLLVILVVSLGALAGTLFGNTRIKRSYQRFAVKMRISSQLAAAYQAAPKVYQEWTIITEENQIDSKTGKVIEISYRTTRAQRSDGTKVMMRESNLTGPSFHLREISYPDSHFVTLFDDVKLKSSAAALRGPIFIWGSKLVPESDCTSRRESYLADKKKYAMFTLLGKEVMNGFAVSKLQTANGQLLWLSPDMDCETFGLEVPDTPQTNKSQCANPGVITRDHLITATMGTPDLTLFNESCCIEARPSQVWSEASALTVQLRGGSVTEANQARLDILNDPEYQRKDAFWVAGH